MSAKCGTPNWNQNDKSTVSSQYCLLSKSNTSGSKRLKGYQNVRHHLNYMSVVYQSSHYKKKEIFSNKERKIRKLVHCLQQRFSIQYKSGVLKTACKRCLIFRSAMNKTVRDETARICAFTNALSALRELNLHDCTFYKQIIDSQAQCESYKGKLFIVPQLSKDRNDIF